LSSISTKTSFNITNLSKAREAKADLADSFVGKNFVERFSKKSPPTTLIVA
jgi:hypothetical protein